MTFSTKGRPAAGGGLACGPPGGQGGRGGDYLDRWTYSGRGRPAAGRRCLAACGRVAAARAGCWS